MRPQQFATFATRHATLYYVSKSYIYLVGNLIVTLFCILIFFLKEEEAGNQILPFVPSVFAVLYTHPDEGVFILTKHLSQHEPDS